MPDPTELTDKAIAKAVAALTDYIDGQLAVRDERLRGIDEATRLRMGPVDTLPHLVDEKVARLADLMAEKFRGVQTQMGDRDVLAQRESELNKTALDAAFKAQQEAVAAALKAQQEAAARQDEANEKSILKSERATAETISTNLALTRAATDGLTKGLDEIKLQVSRIEAAKLGAKDDRTALYATVAVLGTVLFIVIALAGIFATRGA